MDDGFSARKLDFGSFCNFVFAARRIKPSKAGTPPSHKILDYFASFTKTAQKCSDPETGVHIFRLLYPELDIRRRYGLKEKLLLDQLYDVFEISRDGQAARILRQWDDPEMTIASKQPGTGCLGLQVMDILQNRRGVIKAKPLTLEKVNMLLDELARFSPYSNLQDTRDLAHYPSHTQILKELYSPLDPSQAAVMTQIILKDLTPLLYPPPSSSPSVCLRLYNANAYKTLELRDAMRLWHWSLPTIYRYRNDIDEAVRLTAGIEDTRSPHSIHQLKELCKAEVGSLVEIPKARKGADLATTIHYYQSSLASNELWCETKYDGERMQIHVNEDQRITIFSKSKRDSTNDRLSTHPIIRAALGMPLSQHRSGILEERSMYTPASLCPVTSIIVEAEMVAFNETHSCIDEFWRIGQMKARDDKSGASIIIPESHIDSDVSQTTSGSTTPDMWRRGQGEKVLHFQLVFFDVLYLNGQSLLHETYQTRRDHLNRIIRPIPGFSMVTERRRVDLSESPEKATERLQQLFKEACDMRDEGLMLKPSHSSYNDMRRGLQWTKLKKDYIEGLGDSGSFVVVGASHDKERGRQLGVSPAAWTTFYVGLQTNRTATRAQPHLKPDYHVLFNVSWGLDRAQLDYINDYAKRSAGPKPYLRCHTTIPGLPYTFSLSGSLETRPTYIFTNPMVFEVYGGGWTRASGALYYSLRFPRISNLHCHNRSPSEALDLEESEAIAARALSKDISFGHVDADKLWFRGRTVSPLKSPRKRLISYSPSLEHSKRSKTTGHEHRFAKHQNSTVPSSTPLIPYKPLGRTLLHHLSVIGEESSISLAQQQTQDHTRSALVQTADHDQRSPSATSRVKSLMSSPMALSNSSSVTSDVTKLSLQSVPNQKKATADCTSAGVTPVPVALPPVLSPLHLPTTKIDHFWCYVGTHTTTFSGAFSVQNRLHSARAIAFAAGWTSSRAGAPVSKNGKRGYIFVDVTYRWRTQLGALLHKVKRVEGAKPLVVYDVLALGDLDRGRLKRQYRVCEIR